MRKLSYEIVSDRTVKPPRAAARMTCSGCGAHGEVTMPSNTNNPEEVAKWFAHKGWTADPWRHRYCLCPECTKSKPKNDPDSELRRFQGVTNMTSIALKTPTPEEATREPTAQERQKIRRRLDEVFDDSKGMYLEGQSDQSIGKELDIPWAIVRKLREVAYGQILVDEQVDKTRNELQTLKDALLAVQAEATKHAAALVEFRARVDGLSAKVDRALSDVGAVYKRMGM
jgi:hypothetical protein